MKTLYEAYDQDDVPMEEFDGVTLDDLYRVETTFQTNVCMYKLVKLDAEDGKSTAELIRRSLCHYIFPSSKMYACTVTRIDVGSAVTRYGIKRLCCAGTSACIREVCVVSIPAACTIRLHQCSYVWTTRTFECPNRCGAICIQHQRTEQTSQRHRQGRVPGGATQPSERKWKEPRFPGASVDRIDVRAGTGGPHLLPRQTRGARGRGEHGSGGRVEKAMHSGRLS